jgi:hypothetical protein
LSEPQLCCQQAIIVERNEMAITQNHRDNQNQSGNTSQQKLFAGESVCVAGAAKAPFSMPPAISTLMFIGP